MPEKNGDGSGSVYEEEHLGHGPSNFGDGDRAYGNGSGDGLGGCRANSADVFLQISGDGGVL